ncbi:MAG TPA: phosphate acyltransferase PlsX [Phycisphaerae bacterium]|nr:phosphate acyltransferase PlsX [Phycisphaerae bacterium]
MRIAIDAMGGDQAPDKILQGAVESLEYLQNGDELILVGQEEAIRSRIGSVINGHSQVRIEPAAQVIGMDESPVEAVRQKRDSSIVRMVKLAAAGSADAIISAGNTGALVAAGVLMLKPLPGVERPGIAVTIPTSEGFFMLCDAGANIQPKPVHLYQYAILASIYSEAIWRVKNPRIGLLNIGTEEEKGTPLVKETRQLMEKDKALHFVGYVEGRDLFNNVCDVVITDGFTGNVTLKIVEGLTGSLLKTFKSDTASLEPALLAKVGPVLKKIQDRYDHEEYGGALLLGVSGLFLKVHGSSGAKAIRNAVRSVKETSKLNINERIASRLGPA